MRTAVDLYSGAGGMATGLRAGNINVLHAVDIDDTACRTYHANHPDTTVWCMSVKDWLARDDIIRFATSRRGISSCSVDLVVGGPPCQPFSAARKQKRENDHLTDSRNQLNTFMRAVTLLRPRAFLMENVATLGCKYVDHLLQTVVRPLQESGYDVVYRVVDAADYGVPQTRKRLFVIGTIKSDSSISFRWPSPNLRREPLSAILDPTATVGTPVAAKVTYCACPVLRNTPFGGFLVNGGGRPLDFSKPSPTICASTGGNRTHVVDPGNELTRYHAHLLAGNEPRTGRVANVRRLSPQEMALIQTFPVSYVFLGSVSVRCRQIGNAVPPLLVTLLIRGFLVGPTKIDG